MGFFRRTTSQQRTGQVRNTAFTAAGPGLAILAGDDDLEVVGESFHQEDLWSLVGGRGDPARHVRQDVVAVLTAEPENPYDCNAVAVSIDGYRVGHLSREDACLYQSGLLALQRRYGRQVALRGVIVGGGIREDGPGKLGVFLSHHREDFGVEGSAPPVISEPRVRTGRSEVLAATNSHYADELGRISGLQKTDVSAIPALRRLLIEETDPIRRHFVYAEIEARLYRCRDVFASALGEFDHCCQQHDAEMDGICQAFMAELGGVPLLELYRQMAVRQQKIHDYRAALRWAERGIALYSGRAATPEGIDDLRHRAATCRAKLATGPG